MRRVHVFGRLINHLGTYFTKMANMKNKEHPFTIIVEGNIGSGKTTFLNHFKKYKDICLLAEPIEMWRNCDGNNLLGLLYEDPKRWSFTFQLYVLLTMLQQHTLKTGQHIKLMERSLYSARYCFIEKMSKEGFISPPSKCVLDEHFKWAVANTDVNVDLVVYLRTTPEVVYERMIQRNRQEEKTISLNYLRELHDIHENWLYHKSIFTCPAPVLTLNANLDKSSIVDEYAKSETHIFNKIPLRA